MFFKYFLMNLQFCSIDCWLIFTYPNKAVGFLVTDEPRKLDEFFSLFLSSSFIALAFNLLSFISSKSLPPVTFFKLIELLSLSRTNSMLSDSVLWKKE